jgi:hypothetical protein
MAVVLKLKSKRNVTLYIRDKNGSDCGYQFMGDESSPDSAGRALILNEDHATLLMAQYGEDLEKVPEDKWSAIYKNKVKEYSELRQNEAKALFPDIFEGIKGKEKGEKK